MADAYWKYGGSRLPESFAPPPSAPLKRTRAEYGDIPGAPDMHGYYPRDEGRVAPHTIRDTESINASYDRYLRNGVPSYTTSELTRPVHAHAPSRFPIDDPRLMGVPATGGYAGVRKEAPLPPDASNTLFVEGLPANCTRREVSHVFRPFVGFHEVRLVTRESRNPGGDPLVLCFVDFANPSQATVALDALQGYKFDEHEKESATLRVQFARHPGPRSGGGGPRARR